jgi:hypothetical protein
MAPVARRAARRTEAPLPYVTDHSALRTIAALPRMLPIGTRLTANGTHAAVPIVRTSSRHPAPLAPFAIRLPVVPPVTHLAAS